MKFDINDYFDEYRIAMCCRNIDEANVFTQYLHAIGKRWISGRSYATQTWAGSQPEEGYGYNFNVGSCCDVSYYRESKYKLIWFSDFEWDDCGLSPSDDEVALISEFISEFHID